MTDVEFLIVGAGACGLLTAVKLQQAGYRDFLILERASSLGGTWRDNTYPGLTCDVPSYVYEFSFAPHDWPRVYATRDEIMAYLESVAARFGLAPRYDSEVVDACWRGRWEVTLRSGERLRARVLFLAPGAQGKPLIPDLQGFSGDRFHSARWPADYDFGGKRVGVVGTAASAVQLLPEVARRAREVVVFQRTASWVFPKRNRAYHPWESRRWYRWRQDLSFELFRRRWMQWLGEQWALARLRRVIRDPALRSLLTPRYPLGCKRILLANDFYETLALPHVRLVQAPAPYDGLDTLVLATGFQVGEPPFPVRAGAEVLGREAWLGVMAAGFPNLFRLLGPNSGLGHNSVWLMAEAQADFAIAALREARGRAVSVRPSVVEAFNRGLPERFAPLVWSAGCGSWYEQEGRIFALYPGSVASFRRELSLEAVEFG